MAPNTVKVDRSTRFGNPFRVGSDGTQAQCIEKFRQLMAGEIKGKMFEVARETILSNLDHLRGKNLACWCKLTDPCHADVLLELANNHV